MTSSDRPNTSLLALGGALLSGFALVGAAGVLLLYLASPSPILLVMTFLFALLAPVGGVMGFLGGRGARRKGHGGVRVGWAAVAMAAATLGGVIPATWALGLPRFRRFQLESREQQARHNLDRLRMGALSFRIGSSDGRFPQGDSGWVPRERPTAQRYKVQSELWQEAPWSLLDFVPSAAHFHQYRYRALDDGRGFVLSARGDIDGDGVLATTTATVRVSKSGEVTVTGPERSPEQGH